MKRFALATFEKDNSISVIFTKDIQYFDEEEWAADKSTEWVVNWKSSQNDKPEHWTGVVLVISDDKKRLLEKRESYIERNELSTPCLGKGKSRQAKRALIMEKGSSQESSKRTKKKSSSRARGEDQLFTTPKRQVQATQSPQEIRVGDGSCEEEVNELRKEVKDLHQKIQEMKGQLNRIEGTTTRMESLLDTSRVNAVACVMDKNSLPSDDLYTEKITKTLVKRGNKTTAQKLVNDILHGIYSADYMANHTSDRKSGGKMPLPKDDVLAVTGIVQHYFPYATFSSVKANIRIKLNNAVNKAPQLGQILDTLHLEESEKSDSENGEETDNSEDDD